MPDDPESELTLDVIPAIYVDEAGGRLWVPDREKKDWILSHPQGHIDKTSDLNARSYQKNTFVRLTKTMKWWWQYQWERRNTVRRKPYSQTEGVLDRSDMRTVCESEEGILPGADPRTFGECVRRLRRLSNDRRVPELPDPGLSEHTIKTSMTDTEFTLFLEVLEQSLNNARAAADATTERRAAQWWQKLFGDKLPLPAEESKSASLLKPAAVPSTLSFPNKALIPSKPAGFA